MACDWTTERKDRESRRRQRQSGLQETELQDLQLGVVM